MVFRFNIYFVIFITLPVIALVVASHEDPLSDEFILEINRKATTWKVRNH